MRARRTCGGKIVEEDGSRRNCPRLATQADGLCDGHRAERERRRGSSTARGYDAQHARTRASLLADLFRRAPQYRACPLCGDIMLRSDRLALDHTVRLVDDPSARGDRIVHAACNDRRPKAPESKT